MKRKNKQRKWIKARIRSEVEQNRTEKKSEAKPNQITERIRMKIQIKHN